MSVGGQLIINLDKKDEEAILSIRDNGNGISEEDLKKIFTPFFTSKENGTGLGLVVCKRIIESFNGTIEIKSKINKGTEVIITLPLPKKGLSDNHQTTSSYDEMEQKIYIYLRMLDSDDRYSDSFYNSL